MEKLNIPNVTVKPPAAGPATADSSGIRNAIMGTSIPVHQPTVLSTTPGAVYNAIKGIPTPAGK